MLAYRQVMAPVSPLPRSVPGSLRSVERARPARPQPPLAPRTDARQAPVDERARRERVRMDMLVARARAARS